MKYINILKYENRQDFLRLWKVEKGFDKASLGEISMEMSAEPVTDWFVSHLSCFELCPTGIETHECNEQRQPCPSQMNTSCA